LYPSIALTAGRTGSWTADEDIKLKKAIEMHGDKDWIAISALVPSRTKKQCWNRWHVLDPSIDRVNGRAGKWTDEEDLRLRTSVQMHGDKDWVAVAALVPSRTKSQCRERRFNALDPSIAPAIYHKGAWTEDEDFKLKNSVEMHGGKDWAAIAVLVPGRTRSQCCNRWHDVSDPSIALTAGSTGRWTVDEDINLKHAVQTRGSKSWVAVSALVTLTARRRGKWAVDEDLRLKNSVEMHGGKDWAAIAELVLGRTKK
jgi:myb proto-oncogene protein